MRFYQGLLPRMIWSPSDNKVLVDFSPNGEFETEDEDLIKLLRGKGYPIYGDMLELEATGTLPHGGFEKVIEDGELPSGRPSIEEEVTGQKAKVRPRNILPATEAQDLVGGRQKEPTMNIPEVKSPKGKKPARKITRRNKK